MLVADSIGKRYGDRWVLRAATLRALPGQIRALVGRNGVGKSTLLKAALGLVRPDYGVVHLDGAHVPRPSLPQLARRGVFYLPHEDLLSPSLTVDSHLACAARAGGASRRGDVVAELRLDGLLRSRPHQLSGGETRRVELAIAVLRDPRCLLADEPFRGIAPIDAELLVQMLRRLAHAGCAVVVTGHEIATLFDAADHVSWCTEGTTYELGPPAHAVLSERFQRLYLGPRAPALR